MTRLFFDGDCGLCRGAVRLVARHDRTGRIRFAPLGGETFRRMFPVTERCGLPDSLLVLTPGGERLTRSKALVHLLGRMGGGWRIGGVVLAWLPDPARELGYRLVAWIRPRGRACPRHPGAGDSRFDP